MMTKRLCIGIDEVGRGPLAGPITVAAVAATVKINEIESRKLFTRFNLVILKDIKNSKKLNPLQREKWDEKIRGAFMHAIASVGSSVIDKRGINYAAKLAVSRCLIKFTKRYTLNAQRFAIILDGGLYAPKTHINQQTIIKGDERHPLIAAASIIAKVHRDAFMRRLHAKFPAYGFDRHKGYGTKAHQEAIRRHGLSSVHRYTFCANI